MERVQQKKQQQMELEEANRAREAIEQLRSTSEQHKTQQIQSSSQMTSLLTFKQEMPADQHQFLGHPEGFEAHVKQENPDTFKVVIKKQ